MLVDALLLGGSSALGIWGLMSGGGGGGGGGGGSGSSRAGGAFLASVLDLMLPTGSGAEQRLLATGCLSGLCLGFSLFRVGRLLTEGVLGGGGNGDRGRGGGRGRHLSHLHHLDARAARHNSLEKPPAALAERKRVGDNSDDGSDRIFQVVLTGGPCAGKSSSMQYLADKLHEEAFDVYLVPEVPTLLLNGGCIYPGEQGGERLVAFEASLIELQLQMEQTFYNIARSTGRHSVILYDRGLLDVAAYLPRALWPRVLNFNQWVRDGMLGVLERYDLIVHLVTAADGAEQHFRKESLGHVAGAAGTGQSLAQALASAKELDGRVRESYRGHPQHFIVDNSTSFEDKLERVFRHLEEVIKGSQPT